MKIWHFYRFGTLCFLLCVISCQNEQKSNNLSVDSDTDLSATELVAKGNHLLFKFLPVENEKAIEYFKKAIGLDPRSSDAYSGLSSAYSQRVIRHEFPVTWLDSAAIQAEKALAINSRSIGTMSALALIYDSQSKNHKAREYYEKCIEIGDNSANNGGLAYMNMRLGDIRQAHFYLNRDLNLSKSGMPYSDRGDLFTIAGEYKKAEACYDSCRLIQPDLQEVLLGYSYLKTLRGNAREGLDIIKDYLDSNPEETQGLWVAGFAAMMDGEVDQAWSYFSRGNTEQAKLTMSFAQFVAYRSSFNMYLGHLSELANQHDEALKYYHKGLKTISEDLEFGIDNPWLMYDQTVIHAALQEWALAKKSLEQAVEMGWVCTGRARIDPLFKNLLERDEIVTILNIVEGEVEKVKMEIW